MSKRLSSILAAMALLLPAGSAAAQSACENMRVFVRNSVFEIHGLDAFCAEFNKMKDDLASTRSALSNARAQNALLEARLAAQSTDAANGDVTATAASAQAANHTEE